MSKVYTVKRSDLQREYDVNGFPLPNDYIHDLVSLSDIIDAGLNALNQDGLIEDQDAERLYNELVDQKGKMAKALTKAVSASPVRADIFDVCAALVSFKPNNRVVNSGAYVIVGKARSGKTVWINKFTKEEIPEGNNVLYIQQDECETDEGESLVGIDMLCEALEIASRIPDINTIVIDSIREIQYEASGTTLPGGVNADFFRMLTRISNIAKAKGLALFLVYNPQAEKNETYDMVVGMVDGAVHGIVDMNKSQFRSRFANRTDMSLSEVATSVYKSKLISNSEETQEINV